jgi:hypothetical protein
MVGAWRARKIVTLIVGTAVVMGCTGQRGVPSHMVRPSVPSSAAPSHLVSPSATADSTPSATVAPATPATPPAGLETRFRTERDGIRVTVQLDRNPLPAGEPTWATVAVTNIGQGILSWTHDGCAIPVAVRGHLPGASWRPGQAQTGPSAEFKERVIEQMADGIAISFVPEEMVGVGRIGCADTAITDTILAGRSITQRAQWDGMAYLRLGLPPSGPLTIRGWAGYYFRGRHEPPNVLEEGVIELDGDAWIVGGKDPSWLDPPEVIDVALGRP